MSGAHLSYYELNHALTVQPKLIAFVSTLDSPERARWLSGLSECLQNAVVIDFAQMSFEQKQSCPIAIVANPDPADMLMLPNLQWIQSVWAGVEGLVQNLPDNRVPIVRLVDPQLAKTMTEAVLAWTLYLHRDMPAYSRAQRLGQWQPRDYIKPEKRRIGVLGLGELGRASCLALQSAHFMVQGWSREPKEIAGLRCFSGLDSLDSLLSTTDILVCLLPLTPLTRRLLDARALALLPKSASIINFARGLIVDDEALHSALDSGHLNHAVLDVFATEPLPASSWHWNHPSVTITPHVSAPTDLETASAIVCANVNRYFASGQIPVAINPATGY